MKKINSFLFLLFLSLSAFAQWDVQNVLSLGDDKAYDVIVGPGRNDGVNRCYITCRSETGTPDGAIYEASFDGSSWSITSTLNSTLNNLPVVDVGAGRNDGVQRVYVAEWYGTNPKLYEYTWNGTSWDESQIDVLLGGVAGIQVGDARGDGVFRVYATGINVDREYTWNGSGWNIVDIETGQGSEGPGFIGDGRGDGVIRYYAPGQSNKEYTWGGSSWSETSTITPTGSWPETIIFADGRNDGSTRGYMQDYTATFEVTWNGSAWVNTQINARLGRGEMFSARTKSDNKTYIYNIDCNDGTDPLREYSWNGATYDAVNIDAATGATGSIDFGAGRNDDTCRIYATNYNGGGLWEITNISPYVFPRLAWSNKLFTEAVADDGSIDGSITLTLTEDNFVLSSGTLTENTHYTITNLPSSLTAVITLSSDTEATITFIGNADAHENVNNVYDIGITFLDAAFVKGVAADVIDYTQNNISIEFIGPEILWGSTFTFNESALNDGSIDTLIPITLTGGTFTLSSGTLTESTHYTAANVPGGLTLVLTATSNDVIELSLNGIATSHENSDDIANITVTFLNAAFTSNDASAVLNNSKADIAVNFINAGTVNWSGSSLSESGLNDGSIAGSIDITLTGNENFAGATLVEATDYTVANVPTGLTVDISATNSTTAVLTITGNASSHADADDISDLTITFLDAAFQSANSSNITDASKNDIAIDFDDPPATPTIAWADTALYEDVANNGGIFTTLNLFLYVETFTVTSGAMTENIDYYVSSLPAGLSLVVTAKSDTSAEISVTGTAVDHESANNTSFTIDFASSAFTGADSAAVTGSSQMISINFNDAVVSIMDNNTVMSIYPNPATDYIKFNLNGLNTVKLDLINMNGQVMLRKELSGKNNRIDISNLTPGVYLMILESDKSRETKKIVIQ